MKLLLVEDDLDLGNGVRLALQDQRFDVTWVRRIAEARPLLDQGACDLLVLDLGLPDGDGLSLLARVRRERKDRSEEHTSELQSPCNLVCRLLLEKKKN